MPWHSTQPLTAVLACADGSPDVEKTPYAQAGGTKGVVQLHEGVGDPFRCLPPRTPCLTRVSWRGFAGRRGLSC